MADALLGLGPGRIDSSRAAFVLSFNAPRMLDLCMIELWSKDISLMFKP